MAHSVSGESLPPQYRPAGIALAVGSGLLIGSSFVVKKKGLIGSQTQNQNEVGEGVAYLKSPVWWMGMIMMILGEIMNFGAYAFVEAIVVTPLGSLSVVVCAIMSSWFLDEKLTTLGWLACAECIFGSTIIALNGPREQAVATIAEFKTLFLAPWFLVWGGLCLAAAFIIILFVAPKHGDKTMIWYILVCSFFGGLSVSCTQGLGTAIVTSIRGDNQFKNWFIYFLLAFVVSTLLAEVFYLNKALALFNTAMVTPTYYVIFTTCVLATSSILYQGFKASASQIITVVFAFLTICAGIVLLQLSKIDPKKLKVDSQTNLLLAANRHEIANADDEDPEKAIEAPGIDALRGTFGTVGTIVRARRRATIYSTRARSNSSVNGGVRSTDGYEKSGVHRNRVLSGASLASSAIADRQLSFPRGATPSVAEEEPTMSQLLAATPFSGSPEGLTPSLSAGQTPQPPNKKISIEAFTISQHSPIKQHKRSEPTPPTTPVSTARGLPQRASTASGGGDLSTPLSPKAPDLIIQDADATVKASQTP